MEDLTISDTADEQIVFVDSAGQKYRVAIDDDLRRAVRNSQRKSDPEFSPRDIQDLARAGKPAEEIAAELSLAFSTVLTYAQPIFDEIAHVIELTQSVRLELEPDRFGEVRTVELRELISERSAGANMKWHAIKADGPGWNVQLELGNDPQQVARWTFDLKKMLLSPENPVASRLSSTRINDHPLQNLIPSSKDEGSRETEKIVLLPPRAFRNDTESGNGQSEASPSDAEIRNQGVEPSGSAVSLADAIRRRAEAKETAQIMANESLDADVSQGVVLDADVEANEFATAQPEVVETKTSPEEASSKPKGRTSLPSWDQIVFGTKVDDEDQ
jgi:hypothetical protein